MSSKKYGTKDSSHVDTDQIEILMYECLSWNSRSVFTGSVTLNTLVKFSGPVFPYIQNEDDDSSPTASQAFFMHYSLLNYHKHILDILIII